MIRKLLLIWTLMFPALFMVSGEEVSSRWVTIPGDTDVYEDMMERAVFLDVPRRDLLNVIKGYPAEELASRPRQLTARRCFWKAWVLYKENPDSAARLSSRALALCDSARYPYDHIRFSLMQADILRLRGHYADAYAIYRDKLSLLHRIGDRFWEGKVYVAIGALMQQLEEYHEAMRNFRECEEIFMAVGSEACATKNRINIANIQYLLGDSQGALETLDGLDTNRYTLSDSIYLANVLVSKFRISECADSSSVLRALDISRSLGNDHLSVLAMTSVGMLRERQGRSGEAVEIFQSALPIAERLMDFPNLRDILAGLEEGYRCLGMTGIAESYHSRWREIADSLYNHERNDRIRRAEHLATINRYERRIVEENHVARWRLTLIISVSALLLVTLGLSLWLMWMWRRRAETERRLKEEENNRLMLLNRHYSLEIEAKEKELASTTLLMAQKNAQLKDLSRQIECMGKERGMTSLHAGPLKQTIMEQLTADDDWRYFKLRFEKVHPGFFERMKDCYPALSRTELRLCAYIRVGMTAKEIAQVLSVKPDTVNTSRYRIRKKMQLASDASLEAAIEAVG